MYLSQSRNTEADTVVIFISHAGGSGEAYMSWFRYLPLQVDCRYLQLPARGKRMHEVMPDSMEILSRDILDEIAILQDKKIVLFGHSMGGLIAFELVRKIEQYWNQPAHGLLVSGCRAPSEPLKYHFSQLGDDQFIHQLANLGGTDPALLAQPELLELFLPALRQDIALCERYIGPSPEHLRTPLHIIWGTEDSLITDEMIAAWGKYSAQDNIHFYPHQGDHFYYQQQLSGVISIIQKTLSV